MASRARPVFRRAGQTNHWWSPDYWRSTFSRSRCCFPWRLLHKRVGVRPPGLRRSRHGAELHRGDREQALLLPPSLREWLPDGHFAWFVIDAVAAFELTAFYGVY